MSDTTHLTNVNHCYCYYSEITLLVTSIQLETVLKKLNIKKRLNPCSLDL